MSRTTTRAQSRAASSLCSQFIFVMSLFTLPPIFAIRIAFMWGAAWLANNTHFSSLMLTSVHPSGYSHAHSTEEILRLQRLEKLAKGTSSPHHNAKSLTNPYGKIPQIHLCSFKYASPFFSHRLAFIHAGKKNFLEYKSCLIFLLYYYTISECQIKTGFEHQEDKNNDHRRNTQL